VTAGNDDGEGDGDWIAGVVAIELGATVWDGLGGPGGRVPVVDASGEHAAKNTDATSDAARSKNCLVGLSGATV
jgi:hypothetical protein